MANTYFLVMREVRENDGKKQKLDLGDMIEAKAELPDGSAPWFGRVPLMNSPADGHDYGGVHSIIKVEGLSVEEADQYLHPQLGFKKGGEGNLLYNPNARQRSWKLDHAKVPQNHKNGLEGVKRRPFNDKFKNNKDKNKWKHKENVIIQDDTMTLAEFESWITLKPVIPA